MQRAEIHMLCDQAFECPNCRVRVHVYGHETRQGSLLETQPGFDHDAFQKLPSVDLPVELELADSCLLAGLEESLDHLTDELVGLFPLPHSPLNQIIFTDALKALNAPCNELVTDFEFLGLESYG
jgi:hypothetical protein